MASRTKTVNPSKAKNSTTTAAPVATAPKAQIPGISEVDPNSVQLVRAGTGEGRFTPLFELLQANPSKAYAIDVPAGEDQTAFSNRVRYSIADRVRRDLGKGLSARRSRDGKQVIVQLSELRAPRK